MLKILFTVILSSILVFSEANNFNPFGACLKLINPADFTISCAAHSHDIVGVIKQCIKEKPFKPKNFSQKRISNDLSTCDQAKCVTGKYGLLNSKGEISIQKAKKLLKDLEQKGDLTTKTANKLVLDFCVEKDYRVFLSKDPKCTHLSYLTCVVWAYRLANHVNEDLKWMGKCKTIYDNIKACFSKKDLFFDFLSKEFLNKWKRKMF